MVGGVGTIIVVKGSEQIVTKLHHFERNLYQGQFDTGRELMERLKRQALVIINSKKAPRTTGNLGRSVYINVNRRTKSTVYELRSDLDYADKIQGGYPAYIERNITPELLTWVTNNLGEGAANSVVKKKQMRLGFPSAQRPYNPQVGMRFFDDPFAQMIGKIPEEYQKVVDKARLNARL